MHILIGKQQLDSQTVILKCDFSESYGTKYHEEPQAMHYGGSRMLLTLNTSVYYFLDSSDPKSSKVSFINTCTVSEDTRHTAPAVFAHLKLLFQKFKNSGIKKLHIFTDGPSGQYKNKTCFFLIIYFTKEFGFEIVTWNFWESGHGKGPVDAVGATTKNKADQKVSNGHDITDAKSFIKAVEGINVELMEVTSEEINPIEKLVPAKLAPAKGTMAMHQVVWRIQDENNLYLRKRSCNHNEDYAPCSLCDLKTPVYNPLQEKKDHKKTPAKPMSKIEATTSSLRADEKQAKKQPIRPKKHSFAVNDWVAFKEESHLYLGKIKVFDEIGETKKIILENLLSRIGTSKHFECYTAPDENKKITEDSLICRIKAPKELKRPKNAYSIKEFEKIKKEINI